MRCGEHGYMVENSKISIPQGDKTLHFDTIWILKGKNAAQVDFFSSRFQCRLLNGPVCVKLSKSSCVDCYVSRLFKTNQTWIYFKSGNHNP